MSIPEAIKGAQIELSQISNPWHRALRFLHIGRFAADVLAGTLAMAPYGYRALKLHQSLPSQGDTLRRAGSGVSIVRDVRYGRRERNKMDIYIPECVGDGKRLGSRGAWCDGGDGVVDGRVGQRGAHGGLPVVLFCHGGVWASGSKWHYSPLGVRMAQSGVIAVVMEYSLYPDALVPQMVGEVSQALSWTMDNIAHYRGDVKKVSLVGHSAGAHLCVMALIHRSMAHTLQKNGYIINSPAATNGSTPAYGSTTTASRGLPQATQAGPGNWRLRDLFGAVVALGWALLWAPWRFVLGFALKRAGFSGSKAGDTGDAGAGVQGGDMLPGDCNVFTDARMPVRCVAMAGVYDIGKHYEWETWRGVQELSTMKRAVGGYAKFASQSPAIILAKALGGVTGKASKCNGEVDQDLFYRSFPLVGEAAAQRMGHERIMSTMPSAVMWCPHGADHDASFPKFTLEAAKKLPPTLLMSSLTDETVPCYESSEMFWLLTDCGVPAKHLMYNRTAHETFVIGWKTRNDQKTGDALDDLPDCCSDLLKIVCEAVPVKYSKPTTTGEVKAHALSAPVRLHPVSTVDTLDDFPGDSVEDIVTP